MKVYSVFAAALVLLVMIGGIEAQAHGANAIHGAVLDADGAMVDKFTVVVRPFTNKPVLIQRKRFSNGIFTITGLERQKYELVVSAPRYNGMHINVEFPKNGGSTEVKVVVLRHLRSERYFSDSVSENSDAYPSDANVAEVAKQSYRRGLKLYRDGKLEEALAAYGDAIRLDPKYVAPLVDAGSVYLLLNHSDAGLIFLKRAEELAPKNRSIQMNIAVGLMVKNDLGPAIKILESIARDASDKSLAHLLLAQAYYQQKKYSQAEKMARCALTEDPSLLEGRQLLLAMALEQQNYPAARQNLLKLREALNNDIFSRFVDDQIPKMVSSNN